MAKNKSRKRSRQHIGDIQFGGANPERVAADQARRASGAAGVHNAPWQARRDAAGGRTSRVGSRSARAKAAASYGW